ncbi:hypothetical protein H6M51_03645 [Rhizobium sp. AQ_MP]|uniref:hypothetical protein n=1 Tax=Rhizobium sp. AQ_MP TaxID=2761536 RepID=UPI001639D896|nr:hypothetical protein [Rhizobium sp. AQ_MP]MBC2771939.1 hypothetical protein [Rhizobium sp. AQ_MP]
MTAWLVYIFASGWISVVAIVILWAIVFTVAGRSSLVGASLKLLAPNAVSGTALLAAFGLAMRQAPVGYLAGLLALSLIAFLIDLRLRISDQAAGLSRRTE